MTKLDEAAKAFAEKWKVTAIKEPGYPQQELPTDVIKDIKRRISEGYKSGWTAGREEMVKEASQLSFCIDKLGGSYIPDRVVRLSDLKALLEGSK